MATLKNRRSPSLAATPVISPGIARAAVWVGLGAVSRSRGIGWRSGLAAVFRVYYNRHVFKDLFGHYYYYRGAFYNKDFRSLKTSSREIRLCVLSRKHLPVLCSKFEQRTRSGNTRWQPTRGATAHVLSGEPRPATDSFCQPRIGGYRSWDLLGWLASPQSPTRPAATGIQRSKC